MRHEKSEASGCIHKVGTRLVFPHIHSGMEIARGRTDARFDDLTENAKMPGEIGDM